MRPPGCFRESDGDVPPKVEENGLAGVQTLERPAPADVFEYILIAMERVSHVREILSICCSGRVQIQSNTIPPLF